MQRRPQAGEGAAEPYDDDKASRTMGGWGKRERLILIASVVLVGGLMLVMFHLTDKMNALTDKINALNAENDGMRTENDGMRTEITALNASVAAKEILAREVEAFRVEVPGLRAAVQEKERLTGEVEALKAAAAAAKSAADEREQAAAAAKSAAEERERLATAEAAALKQSVADKEAALKQAADEKEAVVRQHTVDKEAMSSEVASLKQAECPKRASAFSEHVQGVTTRLANVSVFELARHEEPLRLLGARVELLKAGATEETTCYKDPEDLTQCCWRSTGPTPPDTQDLANFDECLSRILPESTMPLLEAIKLAEKVTGMPFSSSADVLGAQCADTAPGDAGATGHSSQLGEAYFNPGNKALFTTFLVVHLQLPKSGDRTKVTFGAWRRSFGVGGEDFNYPACALGLYASRPRPLQPCTSERSWGLGPSPEGCTEEGWAKALVGMGVGSGGGVEPLKSGGACTFLKTKCFTRLPLTGSPWGLAPEPQGETHWCFRHVCSECCTPGVAVGATPSGTPPGGTLPAL